MKPSIREVAINGHEVAVRIVEALTEMTRPEGSTASTAFYAMDAELQEKASAAARSVTQYIFDELNGGPTEIRDMRYSQ
jgi:hypothetical protein